MGLGLLLGSVSVLAKEDMARRQTTSSCELGSSREIRKRLNKTTNHALPMSQLVHGLENQNIPHSAPQWVTGRFRGLRVK